MDHTDWLPENDRTIDRIIFEKTSSLLKSKIIVSKQCDSETLQKIKKSLKSNNSKKIITNRYRSKIRQICQIEIILMILIKTI